jgi:hypothetical protein
MHPSPSPEAGAPRTRGRRGGLLGALLNGWYLAAMVPLALDAAEADPLESDGWFPGDLVRGLMEVPAAFWVRYPALYARYQAVLRANAVARQALPYEERMRFWEALPDIRASPR